MEINYETELYRSHSTMNHMPFSYITQVAPPDPVICRLMIHILTDPIARAFPHFLFLFLLNTIIFEDSSHDNTWLV